VAGDQPVTDDFPMPMSTLTTTFTPADFSALTQRDLRGTTCVVFDVLRATSTMLAALANGAAGIIPCAEITEAVALRRHAGGLLLAGERGGLRIRAAQAGGTDFDLGNSPREFTRERVAGRTIAMTTTNGTRALRACAGARRVLIASFANLAATARWLAADSTGEICLVCAGTGEQAAYEDTLGAGALVEHLSRLGLTDQADDASRMAHLLFTAAQGDLMAAMRHSANARRLLAMPNLADDVPLCLLPDRLDFTAALGPDGAVRIQASGQSAS